MRRALIARPVARSGSCAVLLCLLAAAGTLAAPHAGAATAVASAPPTPGADALPAAGTVASDRAEPARHPAVQPSAAARQLVQAVLAAHDQLGRPFVVVDKVAAKVFVFAADGELRAAAPALLGAARGDDSVPGIGDRPLAQVRPFERTTPAGRFVAEAGLNSGGEDIVWIDYDAAVSMHRVRATNPRERRLQRLASPSAADNRISWGCINLPPAFFEGWVKPIFAAGRAVVYVLPEVKRPEQVFGVLAGAQTHALAR